MTFYPRFAESLGTTGFKGRGYLVVDYFLAGKSAHDRRQRDARMHGANVHSIDIGQIADDGDAIDRHWPESSQVIRQGRAHNACPDDDHSLACVIFHDSFRSVGLIKVLDPG
jgi:hypothetical protein